MPTVGTKCRHGVKKIHCNTRIHLLCGGHSPDEWGPCLPRGTALSIAWYPRACVLCRRVSYTNTQTFEQRHVDILHQQEARTLHVESITHRVPTRQQVQAQEKWRAGTSTVLRVAWSQQSVRVVFRTSSNRSTYAFKNLPEFQPVANAFGCLPACEKAVGKVKRLGKEFVRASQKKPVYRQRYNRI